MSVQQVWPIAGLHPIAFDARDGHPFAVLGGLPKHYGEPMVDMHYELEIGIVLQGVIRRRYADGWRHDYGPGDVWFHGVWEPHEWSYRRHPYRHVVLEVWPPWFNSLHSPETAGRNVPWLVPFQLQPTRRPRIPSDRRAEVLKLGRAIAKAGQQQDLRSILRLRSLLLDLLLLAIERIEPTDLTSTTAPGYPENIGPAIALALNSRQPVSTADGSRACHMSERTFARRFPQLMGISFAEFALRARLRGAADELARTDDPVKTTATNWGFANDSHLHRLFVRHYRCTPTAYRAARHSPD